MNPQVDTYDLKETRPIFKPNRTVSLEPVTPTFYEDIDQKYGDFKGHILIQQHEFTEPWESWEIHPYGDEIVYLIDGEIDFVLWVNEAEMIIHLSGRNRYVIVPKGHWHTARPIAKCTLLFITPGEGTRNASHPKE